MKKSVKMLIAAACVTSIVGVGAVSFAKWDPAAANTASGSLTNGYVALSGFAEKIENANWGENLMPYDQGDVAEGATKMITVNLPTYQYSSDYTMTIAQTGDTVVGTYYVQLSKDAVTAPTKAADLADWTAVSKTEETTTLDTEAWAWDAEGANTLQTTEGLKLYIVLDSNNANDMEQQVTFTLTLTEDANN